ncbi:DNA-binding domain-containing protein [Undibacterium sp. TJN19]|uniref:HvfC/BufC N-terminal domain-containing protein n=1 Tax=Undibacterium sp. TJN19 TaxID=3413055 RepID=UPI003BF19898
MTSLNLLQSDFQDFITGKRAATGMLNHIADSAGISRDERLDIYFQAYRLRLRDALSEAFTKTHIYLGDALFYEACAAYIAAHPSFYRNLRWYGDQFPAFLCEHFSQHPQVAELARFEWALGRAFDAPDHAMLALQDIASISDWETVGFALSSSLQFLELQWNSVAIWLALSEEASPPEPEFTIEPVPWIVWRKQLQSHFRSLTTMEARVLLQLQSGDRFADVCELAAEENPGLETDIGGWLQTWVRDELLSGIVNI